MVDEKKHSRVLKVAFVAIDSWDEEHTSTFEDFDLVLEPGEDYWDMMSIIDKEKKYEKNNDKKIK